MTLPSIMVIVATMLFLILERVFPGRELPNSKGWYGRAFAERCGFPKGAEEKLGEMLVFKDVYYEDPA